MASLISVRLNRGDAPSWGFRLQGGKDFGTPLIIQKVIGGSPAERAGLQAGDAVCRINNVDVTNLRHKDAQDVIVRAGHSFDVGVQRGGSSWRPSVTPVGKLPTPRPASSINNISPVTSTSLAAGRQDSIGAIGTGHNVSAKPFGAQVNGGPKLVNKQYNSPLPLYSEQSIAETLSAQSEVLSNGVLGVNFKKNEKSYDAEKSAVYRMLQEAEKEPRDDSVNRSNFYDTHSHAIGGYSLHHKDHHKDISSRINDNQSRTTTPSHIQSDLHQKANPTNQQLTVCSNCDTVIVGVFVRIKDKNLHVECFKCSTCGTSLKNVGYYNLNNKLYCDVHAKLAAKNNPPAPNLTPITIPPGGKIPAGTISAALSSHPLPSPAPLSPNTNYYAAPYQPNSISSPRPFSSVNAPLSPSLPKTSPTPSAPLTEKSGIQNIVWPPVQEKSELPTASPLYFPPPSQVEPLIKKVTEKAEKTIVEQQPPEDCYSLEELDAEVSFYDQNSNMSNYYSAISNVSKATTTKNTMECTETISDTIDTQRLIESVKCKPKPPTPSRDVSVTVTLFESQLRQAAHLNTSATSAESIACKTIQSTETKTCLSQEKQESRTCERKSKVENAIPHKYDTPMVVALTVASDKPYEQTVLKEISKQETKDTFAQIPEKTSRTALATALATAPAEPFTPSHQISLQAVPLPEETIPYLPPERPIISDEILKQATESSKKCFKTKKLKEEEEDLFKDLPKPPAERISLLSALTTAPDRSYTPLSFDNVTYQTKEIQLETPQVETKKESTKSKNVLHESQLTNLTTSKTSKNESKDVNKTSKSELNTSEKTAKTLQSVKSEKSSSNLETVSKNVHSENIKTLQSSRTPPFIQMVRSSFETKTDKVQMEMSCQFAEPIMHTEIQEKTSTIESNKFQDKTNIQESRFDKMEEQRNSSRNQTLKDSTAKSNKVENKSSIKQNVEQSYKSNILQSQQNEALTIGVSESSFLQHAVANAQDFRNERVNITENASRTKEQKQETLAKSQKERVTVIQPGEGNLNVPKIYFQPVAENATPINTTFSPRPRSITPSLINKPAPVIPYYQASIAAMECLPVESNLLDPRTPINSRSPSPCLGRPTSPFPGSTVRPTSPAQGPPPNPLYSQKSTALQLHEEKVKDARSHLGVYIPQHQNRYSDSPVNYSSTCTTTQRTFGINDSAKQNLSKNIVSKEQLLQQSACSRNTEKSSSQNVQVQKTKTVNEEYERIQKCSLVQTEQTCCRSSSSCALQQASSVQTSSCALQQTQQASNLKTSSCALQQRQQASNLQIAEKQATSGFHITNPQPLKSPFTKTSSSHADEVDSSAKNKNIPKKHIVPVSSSASSKPNPSCSGSAPAINANASSSKVVSRPNISQPNVGPGGGGGGGRQAGAIGVAPKRGRGVLNLAATPGSRVPLCAQCHNHIRGPFITALGKIWCPDHFICATASCRRPLHDLGFVEERGQLYCEYCFEQYLAPPCSKCGTKVKGDCLKAIGKNFHPECFNCVYCGKLFGNSPFFLEDCQPYCEADWNEMFTTKCFACGFPVEAGDRWVEALNNNYHSQCFNCTMCKKNLEGQSFFAKGGRPFCKNHAR